MFGIEVLRYVYEIEGSVQWRKENTLPRSKEPNRDAWTASRVVSTTRPGSTLPRPDNRDDVFRSSQMPLVLSIPRSPGDDNSHRAIDHYALGLRF